MTTPNPSSDLDRLSHKMPPRQTKGFIKREEIALAVYHAMLTQPDKLWKKSELRAAIRAQGVVARCRDWEQMSRRLREWPQYFEMDGEYGRAKWKLKGG